jgi:ligand-binding sensor domain-containing protein
MKHVHIYALLMFVFCTPSKGQNKSEPKGNTKSNLTESKAIGTRHAKVNKTQPTENGPAENVHCGLQDKKGNLWFGTTGHGVFYYDGNSFTNFTVVDGLNNNFVWSILEDKNGNIWVGTGEGVALYDGKSFTNLTMRQSFGEKAIWSLLEDKHGRIWISTHDQGTFFYDGKSFTQLTSLDRIINERNLTLSSLNGMAEDKAGNLWFASWPPAGEGLSRYDGQTITRFTDKHGLTDNLFHCVIEDKSGTLWIGSRNHGVFRYDAHLPDGPENSFTHISDKDGPGDDCIYSILEDKSGNIWFATERNGVYRYDGKSFINFSDYGVDEGQPILDSSLNFLTTKKRPSYLSVFSLVEDKDGNIWIGTRNVGLFRYDGKSFVNFSE